MQKLCTRDIDLSRKVRSSPIALKTVQQVCYTRYLLSQLEAFEVPNWDPY